MKIGVVIFPGSNCDQDLIEVLERVSATRAIALWHKDTDLQGCTHLFLPGGFSYGDYLRSGAIAKLSPIMQSVKSHAKAGGFVMGICNGFQILCESGLLPGALLHNTNRKFICKDLKIKANTNHSLLNKLNPQQPYIVPIAHGEGRYYADDQTLESLENNNQIVFKYCNDQTECTQDSNPNGSVQNIAGICNKQGNVLGMMPHPERSAADYLLCKDGEQILKSILDL